MSDRSLPLRGLPLAIVDIEATGFAGPDAHVVEIAVVHATFGDEAVRVAYSTRVRPPIPIPADSTRVHGITDADVADAPTWAEVWPAVAAACEGRLLVGFMAPADHTYIATENARLGLSALPWPWLCLFVVRRATKTRGRPGRLAEIGEEYGIALEAHGAAGDALTTALLIRPMMRRAYEAGAFASERGAQPPVYRGRHYQDEDEEPAPKAVPKTVGELLDWTAAAGLFQEREWAEYRRNEGDALPPVSRWHELAGLAPPAWGAPARGVPCVTCRAPVLLRIAADGVMVHVEAGGGGQLHVCTK